MRGRALLLALSLWLISAGNAHAQVGDSWSDAVGNTYVDSLQAATEQLSIALLESAQLMGQFIDAKTQLETQRTLQKLMARAHKDYVPSEALCRFGTGVKSLARSDYKSDIRSVEIATVLNAQQRGAKNSAVGAGADWDSRFKQFQEHFCDPGYFRNRFKIKGVCKNQSTNLYSADMDFARTLDTRTNLTWTKPGEEIWADQRTAFALARNLVGFEPPDTTTLLGTRLSSDQVHAEQMKILRNREIAALRSIPNDILARAIARKATTADAVSVGPYSEATFEALGVTDILDKNQFGAVVPSYDTQMNVLTKKLYQDPNFYMNLLDKPANVARVRAAMAGVKLMQDRDIYESLLRREALLSAYLEMRLRNNPAARYPQAAVGGRTVSGISGQ